MGIFNDNIGFFLLFNVKDESIRRHIIHQGNGHHGVGRCVSGPLEIVGGFHTAGALNANLGFGQIHLVAQDDQLVVGINRVGKLQIHRRTRAGEINQGVIGVAHRHGPRERSDAGINAVQLAVAADGFDLLEVVAVGDRCAGDIGQRTAALFDRPLKLGGTM